MNQKFYDKTALRVHVMPAFLGGGHPKLYIYREIEKYFAPSNHVRRDLPCFQMFEALWHRIL